MYWNRMKLPFVTDLAEKVWKAMGWEKNGDVPVFCRAARWLRGGAFRGGEPRALGYESASDECEQVEARMGATIIVGVVWENFEQCVQWTGHRGLGLTCITFCLIGEVQPVRQLWWLPGVSRGVQQERLQARWCRLWEDCAGREGPRLQAGSREHGKEILEVSVRMSGRCFHEQCRDDDG